MNEIKNEKVALIKAKAEMWKELFAQLDEGVNVLGQQMFNDLCDYVYFVETERQEMKNSLERIEEKLDSFDSKKTKKS